MNADFFLDTNILIYAFTEQDVVKRSRRRELHELAISGKGIVSYQVVQEFLNAAQRKFATRFSPHDLEAFLETALWPLCMILSSRELYQRAIRWQSEIRLSFYGSLMVAAALKGGCRTLYSEDLQTGRQVHGLEILNPFL